MTTKIELSEIDFEAPKDVAAKTKAPEFRANDAIIDHLIKHIEDEIEKMKLGMSELRGGAMHFDKGTCPALYAIDRFKLDRTPQNLELIFRLSAQDFGKVAADKFREWGYNAFDKGEVEPGAAEIPERPFKDELKNHIFSLFNTAIQRTMSQKEYDLLETNSLRLGSTITKESLNYVKKLQAAMIQVVKKIDSTHQEFENKIADLEKKVAFLQKETDNYIDRGDTNGPQRLEVEITQD